MLSQESNLTVSSHSGRSITSYVLFHTAAVKRVRGLVNLKGFSRVSIPYGKRTRVVSTNVPDSSHYSMDPPQIDQLHIHMKPLQRESHQKCFRPQTIKPQSNKKEAKIELKALMVLCSF